MVVEIMKLAGIESQPVWKAVMHILEDDGVQVHIKTMSRYNEEKRNIRVNDYLTFFLWN